MKSAKFLRKRKFYLVLPLLVLPFVTLAFWALGGGKEAEDVKPATGLNLNLPEAKLRDEKSFDKLSFYNQAENDSLKYNEALRNDPNYKDSSMNVLELINPPQNSMITSPYSNNNGTDANEQKIYKKITELNHQINAPQPARPSNQRQSRIANENQNEQFSKEVDKLKDMMEMMTDKKETDPEMQQINGMLDKILDIQHPDRVKEKVKVKSVQHKQQVFSVQPPVKNIISVMQSKPDTVKRRNDFYDLENKVTDEFTEEHAVEAVIQQTQTVMPGSTVKLRLASDIYINGIFIPTGSFISGTAALENERLKIEINTIRHQKNLLPVALAVYDLDGIAGIHVPGSITEDVARQSTEESLQNLELTTLDPSLVAQAANTGIQAAKNLLSRKAKVIKVTLKAGYKVLLKDNNKN